MRYHLQAGILCLIMCVSAQGLAEPVLTETQKKQIKNGAKLFQQHCAMCHGKTGKGDGPVGKSLKPPPRNFQKAQFKYSKNDKELLAFIQKGKGAMPAWEKVLKPEQIQDIIAYIHTLKIKKEPKSGE